jgi:photosynthetic reaction center cytochrome c subunit
MKLTLSLLGIVGGSLLTLAMLNTWERPPMASTQLGPRGLGMAEIENPRSAEKLRALNKALVSDPPATLSGVKVKDSPDYKNVKLLGDLDVEEFNRLMGAITAWVAPTEGDNAGCAYCHNVEDMASDEVYTKTVARRMLQMTAAINTTWKPHVQETGVTCYTCHRGNAVPANIWFTNNGPPHARGASADRQGQNVASKHVGTTSMHYDPFTTLFAKDAKIRVEGTTALPVSTSTASIKETERTYSLMMHMSQSLGVNCTFCHNSRQFADWSESRPQRVTAWHGIKLVSDVNATYLDSLKGVFPANRLGPLGDVAKVGCATCHQGISKPLYGVSMAKDYPELTAATP